MARTWVLGLAATAAVCAGAAALMRVGTVGRQSDGSYLIPTGQALTPAGAHLEVNDRPLGMVRSPDGRLMAVVTGSHFAPRGLHLIDTKSRAVTATLALGNSFVGVAFDGAGERIYAGGGADNDVKIFRRTGDAGFRAEDAVKLPGAAPSGLALSPDGSTLYVALNLKHTLGVIDTATRQVREIPVGAYPYTVVVAAGGAKVYVSNWGGRKPGPGDVTDGVFPVVLDPRTGIPSSGTVSVVDTKTLAVVRHIDVGLHPSALALSPKGDRLYGANANSDTVSVIDTASDRVAATLNVRLWEKAPIGSSPNALAVASDGTLYVANAANNAVAVLDTSKTASPVRGFIPAGWYPTAVALGPGERQLYIASGYGFGSIAPTPADRKGRSYRDRMGVVSVLDAPGAKELAAYTRQVMANNRAQAVPSSRRGISPIRYVFYIIKENRTYDQVFGDLPQGNGDPSLTQFGREVTPNQHALAEKYVLLDNYYAPGDQSALGHRWCTQGYASDWLHKYGNARNDQNPMLFAPNDFLWDSAKAHGLSVRSYGERGSNTFTPANATWTDIYNDWKSGARRVTIRPSTSILGLKDVFSPRYPAFGTTITDQLRADIFLEDFREFEKNGNLPRLVILLLPANHTNGTAPGYPTPRAMAADNDLALGRIVEAISRSRYWRESAIFVTEDDAQNGLDHVAGHRTVGLVISPWARRKAVDSTFYTTIHMFRTIGQILGLPPANQFDLAAEPMFSVFGAEPDLSPCAALPSLIPLDEMNPPLKNLKGAEREMAEASLGMDMSEPDAAPEETLNRAIWHSVKGFRRPYPATGR